MTKSTSTEKWSGIVAFVIVAASLATGCRGEDGAVALGNLAASSAPVPVVTATPTATPTPTPTVTPTPDPTPEPTCRAGEPARLEIRLAEALKEERKPVIVINGAERDEAEFAAVLLDECGAFLGEAEAGAAGALRWRIRRGGHRGGAEVRWVKGAYAGVGLGKAEEFTLVVRGADEVADGGAEIAKDHDAMDDEKVDEKGERRRGRHLRRAVVRIRIER